MAAISLDSGHINWEQTVDVQRGLSSALAIGTSSIGVLSSDYSQICAAGIHGRRNHGIPFCPVHARVSALPPPSFFTCSGISKPHGNNPAVVTCCLSSRKASFVASFSGMHPYTLCEMSVSVCLSWNSIEWHMMQPGCLSKPRL